MHCFRSISCMGIIQGHANYIISIVKTQDHCDQIIARPSVASSQESGVRSQITVHSLPRHCGLDPQSPSIVCDKGILDQVRDDEYTCH